MIETVCDPYGKTAFPMVVKCDGCGEVLDFGGWLREEWVYGDDPHTRECPKEIVIHTDEHYCDKCKPKQCREFRICNRCKKPFDAGFTDLDGFYCCEDCFEDYMGSEFPGGWRQVEDDGCDGYYEWYDQRECEWCGTGIFYTEWY